MDANDQGRGYHGAGAWYVEREGFCGEDKSGAFDGWREGAGAHN